MFHVVTAFIALYVMGRFIWPLRVSLPGKWVLSALLLLVAEHHLITRNVLAAWRRPKYPVRC